MEFFDKRPLFEKVIWKKAPSPFLSPFSLIYGGILGVSNYLWEKDFFKKKKLPFAKVISVGNLTVGGSGKTPFVIFLAKMIKEMGKDVCVLLRGYGRKSKGIFPIPKDSLFDVKTFGDEASLILKNAKVPIVLGKNREKAALLAKKLWGSQIFILDDGFQYRKIEKDLDILMVCGIRGFGNRKLLPQGPLREPISQIKRADLIIVKDPSESLISELKSIFKKPIFRANTKIRYLLNAFGEKIPISDIKGRKITSICGIGNPHSFLLSLEKEGIKVQKSFIYRDHRWYREDEIERICKDSDLVLTTEKDFIRMEDVGCKNLFYCSLDISLDDPYFLESILKEMIL